MSFAKTIGPILIAALPVSQAFADTAVLTVNMDDNAIQTTIIPDVTQDQCLALAAGAAINTPRTTATVSCIPDGNGNVVGQTCHGTKVIHASPGCTPN